MKQRLDGETPMNILFAASEMVPFCKTGGLADVVGALPLVLAERGHNVSVMLPGYSVIDRERYGFELTSRDIAVQIGTGTRNMMLSLARYRGIDVFLLENDGYFSRAGLYGDEKGDYVDNSKRFIFFSRGVLKAAKYTGFMPDIVHTHDWQAGLVNTYLATIYADDPLFSSAATLFTVHNLGYQGLFPPEVFYATNLPWECYHWTKLEHWGNVSFLKGGLIYADALSTVSAVYAGEITGDQLGFGMHGVFSDRRADLYGIVNGIDTTLWDPSTDPVIPARYSAEDCSGKRVCRRKLAKTCGFSAPAHVPVIGMVTRLDDQKGLDIFEDAAERLMALDVRIVVLGTGLRRHHETMTRLTERYPGRLRVFLTFDNDLARLIYAGSDAFLMPSRYEPCGLGQLIAMRYGTLPIVHDTGGLKETVQDIGDDPGYGVGFVFDEYSGGHLAGAVERAAAVFRDPRKRRWNDARNRAMRRDFSWSRSAERYEELYLKLRNEKKSRA